MRKLRAFQPSGQGRDKIATLLREIRKLKLVDHPHAFCFILRSLFELSAKAYCADHQANGGPSATDPSHNNQDKKLIDVLREVANHMIVGHPPGRPNQAIQRDLHGPLTELANHAGLLSVTSMNQLIHNPQFTVDAQHVARVFNQVFPLLQRMNP